MPWPARRTALQELERASSRNSFLRNFPVDICGLAEDQSLGVLTGYGVNSNQVAAGDRNQSMRYRNAFGYSIEPNFRHKLLYFDFKLSIIDKRAANLSLCDNSLAINEGRVDSFSLCPARPILPTAFSAACRRRGKRAAAGFGPAACYRAEVRNPGIPAAA